MNEEKIRSYEERAAFLEQRNKSLTSADEGKKYLEAQTVSLTEQLSVVEQ